MNKFINYFLKRHKQESLIIQNKAKTLLVINVLATVLALIFFTLNLRSGLDSNNVGKIILPFVMFLVFATNLYFLKRLKFRHAGNFFATSVILF